MTSFDPSTSQVTVDPEIVEMAAELDAVRKAKSTIVAEEKALREKLIAVLDAVGADVAISTAGLVIFNKKISERSGVDKTKLEALYPEVYEQVKTKTDVTTLVINTENL